MLKIIVTAGPIPAKLDSVKYITNRFKGGQALETARYLERIGHDVALVKWRYTSLDWDGVVKDVDDVDEYYEVLRANRADVYILAAAVANIQPAVPMKCKFPSHDYKEGDVFPIEFTLCKRAITKIREWHPNAFLIGYKLLDAGADKLIKVAKELRDECRAHIIFANNPNNLGEKHVITSFAEPYTVNSDKHRQLIGNIIVQHPIRTKAVEFSSDSWEHRQAVQLCEQFMLNNTSHGSLAVRVKDYVVMTGRGHRGTAVVFDDCGTAVGKPTLNAPAMFNVAMKHGMAIHRHSDVPGDSLILPGTIEERTLAGTDGCNLPHHGTIRPMALLSMDWKYYHDSYGTGVGRLWLYNKVREHDGRIMEVGGGNNPLFLSAYQYDPPVHNMVAMQPCDIAFACDSIHYLSEDRILDIMATCKHFYANGFYNRPVDHYNERDVVTVIEESADEATVSHVYRGKYTSTFKWRSENAWSKLGFKVTHKDKTLLLEYHKND